MTSSSFSCLLAGSALVAVCASSLVACSGKTNAAGSCVDAVPPPIVTDARVFRLDVLDLGETRDVVNTPTSSTSTPRARSYGYDLDGLCSDGKEPATLDCKGTRLSYGAVDSDGGIDNAFGRTLLPYLEVLYEKPSQVMSGFSYLETRSDGSGTLHLGTKDGIVVIVPLVAVRIAAPTNDTLGTVAAIAPRDALATSVRAHFNLIAGDQACTGGTVDSVVQAITDSPDVLLHGPPNPDLACDGISIGLKFSGTAAVAVPAVSPSCPVK